MTVFDFIAGAMLGAACTWIGTAAGRWLKDHVLEPPDFTYKSGGIEGRLWLRGVPFQKRALYIAKFKKRFREP